MTQLPRQANGDRGMTVRKGALAYGDATVDALEERIYKRRIAA